MALGDGLTQNIEQAGEGVASQAGDVGDPAKGQLGSRAAQQTPANQGGGQGAGAGAGSGAGSGAGNDPNGGKKESLRIHITLNLDVELHLTARVKGDIMIGLL